MKIYYKHSDRTPSAGDIKILKNGDVFIRRQRRYNGAYCVSSGRPIYDWLDADDERVVREFEDYQKHGVSKHYEQQKGKKGRTVIFDFSNVSDRLTFQQMTGIKVSKDTTIKTAKLST